MEVEEVQRKVGRMDSIADKIAVDLQGTIHEERIRAVQSEIVELMDSLHQERED